MEFTLNVIIKATSETLYNAWLNSVEHGKMTGSEASITNVIGDKFTSWDGYIEGENIALEPNRRIVQTWRTSDFEEDEEDSQIEILLNELDGSTELTLIHSKLSENGEQYKDGWKEHYFAPMKSYFNA